MVAETIHLPIDIDKLRSELLSKIEEKPIVSRSSAVGGWALQSTNGNYTDGWDLTFNPYSGPGNKGPEFKPLSDRHNMLKTIQEFVLPTEINTPYLTETFKILNFYNLNARKARS